MTTHGDHLRDELGSRSADRSAFNVELNVTHRQLSVMRTEIGVVRGQLTEQKRLQEESEQKATNVQYEQHGAKRSSCSLGVVKIVCRWVSTAF